MMPILDCQLEGNNKKIFYIIGYNKIKQTIDVNDPENLVQFIVDIFNSTAERDIYTGIYYKYKFNIGD